MEREDDLFLMVINDVPPSKDTDIYTVRNRRQGIIYKNTLSQCILYVQHDDGHRAKSDEIYKISLFTDITYFHCKKVRDNNACVIKSEIEKLLEMMNEWRYFLSIKFGTESAEDSGLKISEGSEKMCIEWLQEITKGMSLNVRHTYTFRVTNKETKEFKEYQCGKSLEELSTCKRV